MFLIPKTYFGKIRYSNTTPLLLCQAALPLHFIEEADQIQATFRQKCIQGSMFVKPYENLVILDHLKSILGHFWFRLHRRGCREPKPVKKYRKNNYVKKIGTLLKILSAVIFFNPVLWTLTRLPFNKLEGGLPCDLGCTKRRDVPGGLRLGHRRTFSLPECRFRPLRTSALGGGVL